MVCIFFLNDGIAQDSSTSKEKYPGYITGAAFYDFPQSFGATAGVDLTLKHITTYRQNAKGKISEKNKQLFVTATAGFYRYPSNHTGIMMAAFIGTRHMYNNGSFFEHSAGIGALHTVYDGMVYSVDDNGTVKQQNNYGRTYATVNLALSYGWNLDRTKKLKSFTIQVQPMFWVQFPYNSLSLPHGSLILGVKYHLPNFNVRVPHKVIRKSHV
jgi:hypothetical protein